MSIAIDSEFTSIDVSTLNSNDALENKKGTIVRRTLVSFEIDSEDGNTYDAPLDPAYSVGDMVWHSEPSGSTVTIVGHAH